MATSSEPAPTRTARRKAATRRSLLDAACALLVERGTLEISIQEVTDRADVGFGSFYNHFASKDDLFEEAVGELLEEAGRHIDAVNTGVADPAGVFATGMRLSVRMATSAPAVARVFEQGGMRYLGQDRGLAPRARRDIAAAADAGRFVVPDVELALATVAGALFAFLHLRLADPPQASDDDGDVVTELVLRALGLAPDEARALAHGPVPPAAATP